MADLSDFELGHDLIAQRDLLMRAYDSADDERIEAALIRVVNVRRMKKNGTLDWQKPSLER
ncbi:hypothetical protein KUV57_23655 [Epibacterium sp. DP7N7-1]|jgi:hypothetical protein|nr:hypothetical protein [Epibacterium sp. DP7N7-1]